MINYTYSIIGDFPNQVISASCLNADILESEIVTVLDGIYINGDSVNISFVSELTTVDLDILGSIVGNHNHQCEVYEPQEFESPYKITGKFDEPSQININLFGLFRKDVFNNRGELITKEYYKNYDGTTYSDLVVKDEYIYTVNAANDLVMYRDETITWYLEDNAVGITKTFRKYYDVVNAIKEGVTRRTNLLNKAKAYGLVNIIGTHASGIPNSYYWFSTMQVVVKDYLDGTKKQDIIDFIDNETESYVTQEIKDTMTDILDYWSV